ncbi:hypothetical protein TYRP_012465 [Tyrophagus putrescentiae]|nr:hypothetical protein TYRP_012465 [Tyrophagus putrescentiae]
MKSAIFAILFLGLVAVALGQLIAPAYSGYYGGYYGAPIATYGSYSGYPYYGSAINYGYPAYGYSSLLLKK